jgi:hypothetical protein
MKGNTFFADIFVTVETVNRGCLTCRIVLYSGHYGKNRYPDAQPATGLKYPDIKHALFPTTEAQAATRPKLITTSQGASVYAN